MEKNYDNLIYYSICECLYEEMKRNKVVSKSRTFRNLCNSIGQNLNSGQSLTSEQFDVMVKVIQSIHLIYGEDDGKIGNYISEFFKQEMWKKYQEIVTTLYSNLPFAIQP